MADEPLEQAATIRPAQPADWPAIGRLLGRSPEETGRLRQELERGYDPLLVYVAEDRERASQRLAGVIAGGESRPAGPATRPAAPEGRLLWVEVAPGRRRRGLGSRLLEALVEELTLRRYSRLMLLVDGSQFEAQALFQHAGFRQERQTLGLVLPPEIGRRWLGAAPQPAARATLRPLALDDVPLLAGLLIHLGVERAGDPWEDATDEGARGPHDDLPALSPAQLADWLQRPGTVAYGAWEAADATAPLGLAWATRRREDGLLRFVGVHDDARRRGIGTALVGALLNALVRPSVPGTPPAQDAPPPPLRAQLNDPAWEQDFFRALGFQAERVTWQMARTL